MNGQQELFEVTPVAPEPVETLSKDRRRTLRQAREALEGRHPLGLALGYTIPLHALAARERDAEGLTCGGCRFREVIPYHNRKYPKCVLGFQHEDAAEPGVPVRVTHGAGTDVRKWWPACKDFEPGDNAMSGDAARWMPGLTA